MAKSIPAVKIGNETYEIKDLTAREHLVEVKSGNTPPTSPDNKLWIKDEQRTFEVPTMEEFNERIGAFPTMVKIKLAQATSSSIVVPPGSRHIIIATTANGQGYWIGYVRSTGDSDVAAYDILGNTSSQSLSVTATEATRTITFTQITARVVNVIDIVCYGNACTGA